VSVRVPSACIYAAVFKHFNTTACVGSSRRFFAKEGY